MRAAGDLGYRPNVLARSLKRGRSDSILFPLPGLQMIHPLTTLVDACSAALAPLGLSLVRDFSRYDDPAEQLDAWARLAPAAVLDVVLRHDDPVLPGLRASGIPVLSARSRPTVGGRAAATCSPAGNGSPRCVTSSASGAGASRSSRRSCCRSTPGA